MVHVSKRYKLWHLVVAFVAGVVLVVGASFTTSGMMQGKFAPIGRGLSSDTATLQRIESKIDLIMQSMSIFTGQWTVFTGEWTAFTHQMTTFTTAAKKSFIDLGNKNGLNLAPYFQISPKLQLLMKNLNTTKLKMLK